MNADAMNHEEQRIRELLDRTSASMRDKNAAALVAEYATGGTRFDLAPPLRSKGIDEQAMREWFAAFHGDLGYEIRELEITAGEDVAFAHCLTQLRLSLADGTRSDMWFRQTTGLRKIDGRWKITHEHSSTPFHMDESRRAATELVP